MMKDVSVNLKWSIDGPCNLYIYVFTRCRIDRYICVWPTAVQNTCYAIFTHFIKCANECTHWPSLPQRNSVQNEIYNGLSSLSRRAPMTRITTCRFRCVVFTITPISARADQTALSHKRVCVPRESLTRTIAPCIEFPLNYSFRPDTCLTLIFQFFFIVERWSYSIICHITLSCMGPYVAILLNVLYIVSPSMSTCSTTYVQCDVILFIKSTNRLNNKMNNYTLHSLESFQYEMSNRFNLLIICVMCIRNWCAVR